MNMQKDDGWESPHTSDWDKISLNGKMPKDRSEDEIVISDTSSYVKESSSSSTEEYFTSMVDQTANEGIFDPSSNVDTSDLNNMAVDNMKSSISASLSSNFENDQPITDSDSEQVLFEVDNAADSIGICQLTLDMEQKLMEVDLLTPKSKCSNKSSVCANSKCVDTGRCENCICETVVEENPILCEIKLEQKIEDNYVCSDSDENGNSNVDSNDGDNVIGASDVGMGNKQKNNKNNKLIWTPKSSTPIYMSKSEESNRKIELARKKASKNGTLGDLKQKISNLAKERAADRELIRLQIAANAKATADAKAAIVAKEKQRVLDASKARKEARDKYIMEARKQIDVIKTSNNLNKLPNKKNKKITSNPSGTAQTDKVESKTTKVSQVNVSNKTKE